MSNVKSVTTLVILGSVVFLISCSSFNSYDIRLVPETIVPKSIDKVQTVSCPVFELTEFKKTPELPLKEMFSKAGIKISDIEQLERKHIEELRTYVMDLKKQVKHDHERYLLNCLKQ